MKNSKKPPTWHKLPLPKLIQKVQDDFCNPYIRARDINCFGKCISCNSGITQAGHRFPTSTHSSMRFLISNIHGQEISCNHFKSGNLDEYDKGLINRHGQKYCDGLHFLASWYKRQNNKWDRFDVISIGQTYIYLLENKIWIFDPKEFDEIKLKLISDGI